MKALVLAAALALSACSATDVLHLMKPQVGVDVSAQVGKDASKQVVLGDQNRNEVSTDDVAGDLNSTSNVVSTQFTGDLTTGSFTINNMPTQKILVWGAIFIFLLGVLFPSPSEMYRSVMCQVRKIRSVKNVSTDDSCSSSSRTIGGS